jgi:phosphoribosylformylglycinamidine synthase
VGADPDRIAILDNFCWPSCREPRNMGSLVRAAIGCYHGALMYRTPFISGKDSLNNQFRYTEPTTGEQRTIEIPPTLLITGVGVVPDIDRAVTMDLKPVFGSPLVRLRRTDSSGDDGFFRVCADLVASRAVLAAHDVSEGGSAVAAAEMLLAAGESTGLDLESADFDEPLGNILVQLDPAASAPELPASVEAVVLGHVTESGTMSISTNGRRASIATADLRNSFESTFADW